MKKLISLLIFLSLFWTATAQNLTFSGTVLDENEEPVPGAVLMSGNNNAMTDINGAFTFSVAKGATVTVAFMGYDDFVFTADAPASGMVIRLKPSAATLLEESVVIGYGRTTKKELTGSVVSLGVDDFDKGSFTSAAGMLQGKVAGLSVTNPDGGDPNASFELLLRGTGTLAAGQGPLIIIDGVADADIRSINFQEVESVDVLKDGSAAAIYGTRGSNGVIIITTRRAKAGQTSVEYDGQASVQTVAARAMPLTASQFEDVINQYSPGNVGSLYGGDTDWFNEVTRVPFSHKHSLAVSGGSQVFSHRTVANIEKNQGLLKKNDVSKYLIKSNIHQDALEGWLTLDYNLNYLHREYSAANYDIFRQAFVHNPTEPVYDPNNTLSGGYYRIDGAMDYYNPVAMLNERDNETNVDTFGTTVRAILNVLPVQGLKWDNFVSWQSERYESREYSTKYYPSLIGKDGKAYISNATSTNLQWESVMQYSRIFGLHSVQAVAGYTYQQNYSWDSSEENTGFDTDLYKTNNIGAGSALKQGLAYMSSYKESSRYIAFFGRVMYNWSERYLASVSLRYDGSSRFGENNKWALFPAVSLGWRISQEEWLKDKSWLDELKLRVGYGVTGNQDFSNYKSLLLMKSKGHYYHNGYWGSSYAPASNANPDLRWERKEEVNAGLDFSFLKGRLGGTLDFYYRHTTDLLYTYKVPVPPYDYEELFTNVGAIKNMGVELTLNAIPVKTKNFTWNTTLTMSSNKNTLEKLTNEEFKDGSYKMGHIGDPINAYTQRLIEGQSLGTFYGPVWKGIWEDGTDDVVDSIAGRVAEEYWSNLGCAYPKLNLGWSNSFHYRNWSLSASLRSAIGGKVYNTYRACYENVTRIGLRNIISSWLDDTSFTGNPIHSSKYLEDATYLKLDNLTLTYNIPLENKYIKGARVYVTGQNLLCITGYKGVDPEVSLGGLSPGIESTSYYPRTRTFTLGVNLNF